MEDDHLALSTIPESPHFAPDLRARVVDMFGEDGAWLLLSQLWYGWRAYYDLACGLVAGPFPTDASGRPTPVGHEYRIAIDLQVQAYVYAAAEQFATLVYAMKRHEPRAAAFFEAYVGAPPALGDLIDDIGSVDRDKLIEFVGDPASARMPPSTRPSPNLDPASIPTIRVGGIEVPEESINGQAFENGVAGANEVIDLAIKNIGELRQLIDSPAPSPGADRQPQSLRAVDNSFRHGLRVLFHEAAPTTRTFRVAALAEPPAPPSVDLYLPSRGKKASDAELAEQTAAGPSAPTPFAG